MSIEAALKLLLPLVVFAMRGHRTSDFQASTKPENVQAGSTMPESAIDNSMADAIEEETGGTIRDGSEVETKNLQADGSTSRTEVRVLTYNIWFDELEAPIRMEAIGKIIEAHQPDVIALQEMTPWHWSLCIQHKAFQQYHWSEPLKRGYFTMIGSLNPFAAPVTRQQYSQTRMGRGMLATKISIQGGNLPPLVVGCTHLESLWYDAVRESQLSQGMGWIEGLASDTSTEDMLIASDTNIADGLQAPGPGQDAQEKLERPKLMHDWVDAWPSVKPDKAGYTFSYLQNKMVARVDAWAWQHKAQFRYDRFFTRLKNYNIANVEMLGTHPIEGSQDATPIWASDHWGLLLSLTAV